MKTILSSLFSVCFFVNYAQTTLTISICGETYKDACIASGQPTINFGTYPYFGGYNWTCNGSPCLSRGLMYLDLTAIPVNATVTNASLLLMADNNWGANPTTGPGNSGSILKVTSAWTESLVTWATQPTTSGINSVAIPASISNNQDYTVNITALAQDWVNSPANNYGMMIRLDNEVNYYKSLVFGSSDETDETKCPKLIITYVFPTGIRSFSQENNVLKIIPNPFTTDFTMTGMEGEDYYNISEITGKEVQSGKAINGEKISLKEIPDGIYFITIALQNKVITRKIIKQTAY